MVWLIAPTLPSRRRTEDDMDTLKDAAGFTAIGVMTYALLVGCFL